jgi:extracellular factor (EF) 3-hydroxypalmitic acid methyl ester biosynthesis protein
MDKFPEEKRSYPRIKTGLKIGLANKASAESVDLSEGGISFNSPEKISSPTISLKVHFQEGNFDLKAKAHLIWERDLGGNQSLYGVEFINLSELQRSHLRRALINTQITELLAEIKTPDLRKQISHFFLKDVLDYVSELLRLALDLSHKKAYSFDLQKEFDHLTTQILLKGYCLEELLADKKIMDRVKDSFRKLVGTWIYKSTIVKRAFEKPRGYPGDYKMLEIVYDNKPLSKNFGVYSDNCFLKSPYAVAVRIRKDRLRELTQEFINKLTLNKVEILNIACGSCREIKEMLPAIKNKNPIIFTCLDWDEEALDFSEKSLVQNSPENIAFKFLKEDIMNMIKNATPEQTYGRYDLVYSIGLIDYLPDRVLKKLIHVLYRLLRKEGQLILTHKNREKTFPPLPPDWFCDWKFVSRNKEETIKLFHESGMPGFSLSTQSDDFEYIYYFTITKK